MRILALETSCDETACAVVEDGRTILSNVIYTQIDLHARYGGVLPEVAAREHLETINLTIEEGLKQAGKLSLDDMDAFAATMGPGLIGALLIGTTAVKSLCLLTGKPFFGVNHLYAHVASNYLGTDLEPPFLCLLVSGGHTQLIHVKSYTDMAVVGSTRDDAVGEAYDKIARVLKLGYPGGPVLDKTAQQGNPQAYPLPIPRLDTPYDFSFSGLKTATLRLLQRIEAQHTGPEEAMFPQLQQDLAASFQHTAVSILLKTTQRCARDLGLNTVTICGGVSANSALRQAFGKWADSDPAMSIYFPPMSLCTDNAAMVASSAYYHPISTRVEDEVFSRMVTPQVPSSTTTAS